MNELQKNTTILFGSDSTLSADWNIWKHLRLAKAEAQLTDEALLNSITTNAAQIWQLKNTGSIASKMQADIVVAKKVNDDIFNTDPENILLVIKNGSIKLFDASLKQQLEKERIESNDFYKININEQDKYVHGDLPALVNKIRRYYPAAAFPFSIPN